MNELIKPTFYTKEAALFNIDAQKLPWIDARTAGRMLFPDAKDPARQTINIYNRNKSDFTERDTVLLDVDTTYMWGPGRGDMRNQNDYACLPKAAIRKMPVRFLSIPFGMSKLILFSNSKRRAQVSDWLCKIQLALASGTLPKHDGTLAAVAAFPRWSRERAAGQKQIAADAGCSVNTVRRHLKATEEGRPIVKGCMGAKKGYIHKKHRAKRAEVLKLRSEGLRLREIQERTGVSVGTAARWCAKKCGD